MEKVGKDVRTFLLGLHNSSLIATGIKQRTRVSKYAHVFFFVYTLHKSLPPKNCAPFITTVSLKNFNFKFSKFDLEFKSLAKMIGIAIS